MNIKGFDIGIPNSTYDWLLTAVIILSLVVGLIITALFVKYAGRSTVHFIRECLSDATGHGDIKLVMGAVVTLTGFIPLVILGFFYGWPPEGVFLAVGGFVSVLFGLGSLDFMNVLRSGTAIMKPEPPKDILVDTIPEAAPVDPDSFATKEKYGFKPKKNNG